MPGQEAGAEVCARSLPAAVHPHEDVVLADGRRAVGERALHLVEGVVEATSLLPSQLAVLLGRGSGFDKSTTSEIQNEMNLLKFEFLYLFRG